MKAVASIYILCTGYHTKSTRALSALLQINYPKKNILIDIYIDNFRATRDNVSFLGHPRCRHSIRCVCKHISVLSVQLYFI